MLIDWFTVGAQVLNFLILVWLMRRFLYGPILRAIDEREKRIAAGLADADRIRSEAQRERDAFREQNSELDSKRAALLGRAAEEAAVERRRLLDEAGSAADALSARRQEALVHDALMLKRAVRMRTQQEVFAIARQALADLADARLEEQIGAVFVKRLRAMEDPAKALMGAALKAGSAPALVRTALDLSEEQRSTIQTALRETFAGDFRLRFETSPDLVSGIELSANGQKVAWSLAGYLASMEERVGTLWKESPRGGSGADPRAELPHVAPSRA